MVVAVAIFARRLAIDLLAPGAPLYVLVADIQFGSIDGAQWAEEVYVAVAVYVPWLLVGGSIIVGAYREFLRQNVTQVRARQ
jgi:hypothetical protein